MISIDPSDIFNILASHGTILSYTIILILMLAEGPIVNYVAALVASLGYLDIWVVFFLAIFGNQIPDILLYFLGRKFKRRYFEKFASHFWISKKRIRWLEKNIKKHSLKVLFSFKVIPNLPIPGLILCGFAKVPFRKFFLATLVMNVAFAIVYSFLGFYSGVLVISYTRYFNLAAYLIPIMILLIILIYFFTKRLYLALAKISKYEDE